MDCFAPTSAPPLLLLCAYNRGMIVLNGDGRICGQQKPVRLASSAHNVNASKISSAMEFGDVVTVMNDKKREYKRIWCS